MLEEIDGVGDARADERVRAVPPQAKFDPFAVHQDQSAVQGQCGVRDNQVQADGLAGAGLASGEQVALGQPDPDRPGAFIDT